VPDLASRSNDTIAAIATPPGRGGIGILRLSGPNALTIAAPLLRLRAPLEPGRARFCEIIDPSSAGPLTPGKLDEAIATYFRGPRSYTGEDVLEIAVHGSPVLLDFLLRQTMAQGARLANPGEFTERAFLSGRLDLTQAEAVRDLIDAQTLYQARIAAAQLDGALSRRIAPVKTALIGLIAQLEAGIDFAEDDTPTLSATHFLTQAAPIAEQLAALAHSFEHGRLVHSGLTLAIVGAPNVGKSSLFNRLVERERAIVTANPGTTRDLVTERVSLSGIPIELVDTAGLRQAADEAERLGIEKSRQAMAEADLVLLVLDASSLLASPPLIERAAPDPDLSTSTSALLRSSETVALLNSLEGRRAIVVLNKYDLLPGDGADEPATQLPGIAAPPPPGKSRLTDLQQRLAQLPSHLPSAPWVITSAHTGQGLEALRQAIGQQLQTPALSDQGGMLTNLRQHQAVEAARAALEAAQTAAHLPHEMLLLDLYTALGQLDALTGETTPDDILNLIFSTFCIGK
jgi:tRNA modification GTPase